MFIETIKVDSLSNNSYVVGSEQSGRCAVIDPVRDIDQYTSAASDHGVRITYALETHLHNDFVSGSESWPPRPVVRWAPALPEAPYFLRCASRMETSSTWESSS